MVISRTSNTSSKTAISALNASSYKIFTIIEKMLFNRYRTVFGRAVNFFSHACQLMSRMASCFPCTPYPTNTWIAASVIP